MKPINQSRSVFWAGVFSLLFAAHARANVYATDIRVNGSLDAGVITPGQPVIISYILNDNATGGVWVKIYTGNVLWETLSSIDDEAGTNAGLNTVTWEDTSGLTPGAYSISITAASTGYDTWTNISDDGADFMVENPRGIVVNKNVNSRYYGRVFVSNAETPFGIYKFNADGSPGDEGNFGSGGLSWGDATDYSPWKMAISQDDRLYVDDFSVDGVLYEFGQTVETNHSCIALNTDNYPSQDTNPQLSGLAVTGSGTSTQIWMTDETEPGSAGIIVWNASTDGVVANGDTGTIVAPINSQFLADRPYDLTVDRNGYIYVVQFLTDESPTYALMQFAPFEGGPETTPDWESMSPTNAYSIAVDPTATYAAIAVLNAVDDESGVDGALYLYSANNGHYLANVDESGGDSYFDVAWDSVGNLYAVALQPSAGGVWRIYSPPGANQATTPAVSVVQVYDSIIQPALANPVVDPRGLGFTLQGQSNMTYFIQESSNLINWTNMATSFSTNVNRSVHVPACGGQNFYRAMFCP